MDGDLAAANVSSVEEESSEEESSSEGDDKPKVRLSNFVYSTELKPSEGVY